MTPIRSAQGSAEGVPLTTRHSSLPTDLDWIVMKAIEKDREHRYGAAEMLADDLQRFLANEPVCAVAPSRVYSLKKFIRRNRRS